MILNKRNLTLLVMGVVMMTSSLLLTQEPMLTPTVPEITPEQAVAVMRERNLSRWFQELNGKVVRWSGTVVEPTEMHRLLFERLYMGHQLLQLELKELLCEIPVPDTSGFKKDSTITFTGVLGGWIQNGDEKHRFRIWPVKLEIPDK